MDFILLIDQAKVSDAIISSSENALAREEGARLAQHWLENLESFPEMSWKVIAVEVPFYIQLEPKTIICGQMDGIFQDEHGLVQAEWKSRREPKRKKDGTNYLGDDEDGWLGEISSGPQLSVYALAGREGTFMLKNGKEFRPQLAKPRILVRACLKSTPPDIWPKTWEKGLFTFPSALLDSTKGALLSEAASIRARRKLGIVPWQVPGMQCENKYRRTCEYLASVCSVRLHPPIEPVAWSHPDDANPDPGYAICNLLGLDPKDPELIVLSQSALQVNYQCAEKARIDYGGYFPRGEAFELDAGSAMHAAIASCYEQIQASQQC